MPKTGEEAGRGEWECTSCGETINIKEGEKLPECPKCSGTEFEKSDSTVKSGSHKGRGKRARSGSNK